MACPIVREEFAFEPCDVYAHWALGLACPALQAQVENLVDAVVSQPADLYSQYAVKYAQDAASGVKHVEGKTDHNSTISKTKAGILQDSLASPVITKQNADDQALWGNKK